MNGPDTENPVVDRVSGQADAVFALTTSECDSLFAPLAVYSHVLVAVSGGVDSTLLLVLLHEWTQLNGGAAPKLSVAVVDHALRSASRQEAEGVCALAGALALPAAILTWEGEKPSNGLQAAARQARYRQLLDHAKAIGADALALAHHRDDQSETILMRLCAGSGLDGLSGMRVRAEREGIDLVRPLLGISKQRLIATATNKGIAWVDDPSNLSDRFTRVRFRKARNVLAAAGLDAARLNRLAFRMARAHDALEHMADCCWTETATLSAETVVLSETLFAAPQEIRLRLLMRACAILAPEAPQRLERFEALMARLNDGVRQGHSLNSSIAGCLVRMRVDRVRVTREPLRRRGTAIRSPKCGLNEIVPEDNPV